jgi:hypothetical protein
MPSINSVSSVKSKSSMLMIIPSRIMQGCMKDVETRDALEQEASPRAQRMMYDTSSRYSPISGESQTGRIKSLSVTKVKVISTDVYAPYIPCGNKAA